MLARAYPASRFTGFDFADEAGYITGQTIVVDGGQTLPESLAALQAV